MKIILSLFILLFFLSLYGQVQNVNPDPNGEPWLVGGLRPLTRADYQYLKNLPELKQILKEKSLRRTILPTRIDNSINPFFPPVFNQADGSCAQASGIAYTFTYEMSVKRNVHPTDLATQYPSHYTYNFLNRGSGSNGSWYWDGWEIAKANGIPSASEYGGRLNPLGDNGWMTGYEKYESGMANRVEDIFSLTVSTPEGLQQLKEWMVDHGSGQSVGGIVNFAAGATGFDMSILANGTPDSGKSVIVRWGTEVNHAMTFVGYDDSVRYDYNNDGRYTNDEDTNGDGIIDMRDWEIGALIMVNSWGPWFGDQGRCYVMYRLLAESVENGGIQSGKVYGITVKENYDPLLTARVILKHNSRDKIKVSIGVAADAQSSEPDAILDFPLFNKQGGPYYMQGGTTQEENKTLEFGLDITPVISNLISGQPGRIFLIVDEDDPQNEGTGSIQEFAIKNFSDGGAEAICSETNVALHENGRTMLSIPVTVTFNGPEISTNVLPPITPNEYYSHTLEASGGTPPYSWKLDLSYSEASATASFPEINQTALTPGDNDDNIAIYQLPFAFPFYGTRCSQISVSTDGSILFGPTFEYVRNQSSLSRARAIAVFGSDLMLYSDQGDGIWLEENSNSVTIRWKTSVYDHPEFNVGAAVTLFEDGTIQFFYDEGITPGLQWISGVSDGNGNMTVAAISGSNPVPANYSYILKQPSFPNGLELAENGMISGITNENNQSWDLHVRVTDNIGLHAEKILQLTAGSLVINEPDKTSSFVLKGNYPNPFNPSTDIHYTLKKSGAVKLRIYNATGQLINTLIDKKQMAGDHHVQWNGTDANNLPVPSGIYFCQLASSGQISSLKMILIK